MRQRGDRVPVSPTEEISTSLITEAVTIAATMTSTITISIEIELAWGHHDREGAQHPALSDDRVPETRMLERLLEVCNELDLPITFDVVGHLLHESCSGRHDGPHASDWFDADPGTDRESDPHYYAPDLVRMIDEAAVDHEICTHSYSHVLCEEVPSEVVDWELEKAAEIHSAFGIAEHTSFVPPRHQRPSDEVLRNNRITSLRMPFAGYASEERGKVGTFLWMLGRSHPTGSVIERESILESRVTTHPSLTASYLPNGQQSTHPTFKSVPLRLRQWLHSRYLKEALEQAINGDSHLHLWTHLHNLANSYQWRPIERFLRKLHRSIEDQQCVLRTMDELPEIQSSTGIIP